MEIDEFIEQDILIFLDDALDKMRAAPETGAPTPSIFITRDYEDELFNALDKNDITEAKKILHALKKQFDECPSGTPDKQQLKILLVTLYDKFKEHIDAQDTFSKIEQRLDSKQTGKQAASKQDAAPQLPVPPTPPAVPTPPAAPEIPAPPAAPQATTVPVAVNEQQAKEAVAAAPAPPEAGKPVTAAAPEAAAKPARTPEMQEISDLLEQADRHLKKEEIKEAVEAYKEAKAKAISIGGKLPEDLLQQYKNMYMHIKYHLFKLKSAETERKAAEMRITPKAESRTDKDSKAVKDTVKAPPAAQRKERKEQPLPVFTPDDLDKQILLQLEQEKHKLDAMLRRSDIEGSMRQYRKMRVLAQQLTSRQRAKSAEAKLVRIYTLINHIRQHAAHNEQRLMAVP